MKAIEQCRQCPRECGAYRPVSGRGRGVCGMGVNPAVARAGLHMWEEPCISGTRGSGAVFFSGCPLHCKYCQNAEISKKFYGRELTPNELRRVFFSLIGQGAHNINLVTPTHFTTAILEALGDGLPVPIVYNCGGYESVETLHSLEGHVDVYLPDFKYSSGVTARRYSCAADYPQRALDAIAEMCRQCGEPEFDDDGMLVRGVLVRHLVLPGCVENTLGVIDLVRERFGDSVLFSLMSQYTPPVCECGIDELDRRLTAREYETAQDHLFSSGLENGFVQELDSACEKYIPSFDLTGVTDI